MTSTRQRLAGAVRLADRELIDEAQEALAEVEARKARIAPSQTAYVRSHFGCPGPS